MMRAAPLRLACAGAVAILAAALCFPVPAHAWQVVQPLYGVIAIQREASDTVPATFVVYQRASGITATYYANGSYDETYTGGFFAPQSGVTSYPIVIDANGWEASFQWSSVAMVVGPVGQGEVKKHVIGQPSAMVVSVSQAVPIYTSSMNSIAPSSTFNAVRVSNAESLTAAGGSYVASVSVPATITADVWSPMGWSPLAGGALVALLVALVGVGLGRHLAHVR